VKVSPYQVTKGEGDSPSIKRKGVIDPNNPTSPAQSPISSNITIMRPPARTTRSKASPGIVDCTSSRRSSAVVTQEKAKKQQVATLKAKESHRRIAQVGEVEREIRRAQVEASPTKRGGRGMIVKKNFPRPDVHANVSPSDL
jgi:hypothetical protein